MDLEKLPISETPAGRYIELEDAKEGEGVRITFTIQNGPIEEAGENGCQVDDVIQTAKEMIERFNTACPCEENEGAIKGLEVALARLIKRRQDREDRGVEGTSDV